MRWSKNFCMAFMILVYIFFYCAIAGAAQKEVDVGISEIVPQKNIYLERRAVMDITIVNNSDTDVGQCEFSVEADDGSRVSQIISLPKNSSQKAGILWVPQKEGEINFKASLTLPKGVKDTNEKDNEAHVLVEVRTK